MAVKINEIYQCKECGIMTEVIHPGMGAPVCCGEPMTKLEANCTDAKVEKHVPVYEIVGNKVIVTIGEVEHPMTEEHHIEWVSLQGDVCPQDSQF